MPLALDQKVGAVVWSPLGWGRLTGKVRRGQPLPATSRLQSKLVTDIGPPVADEYVYRVVDALDEVARETGKTVPQIALNWLLQRPSVANVIIGARNEEQLRQNLGAVGWNLTAGAGRQARRRQRHDAGLPLLAPAAASPSGTRRRFESRRASKDRTPLATCHWPSAKSVRIGGRSRLLHEYGPILPRRSRLRPAIKSVRIGGRSRLLHEYGPILPL